MLIAILLQSDPTYPHTFVLGGIADKVRELDVSYVSQSFFTCNMIARTYDHILVCGGPYIEVQ